MMLSVVKHTKTPVKFWFLKNYLSPQIKVSPSTKRVNHRAQDVHENLPKTSLYRPNALAGYCACLRVLRMRK